MTYNILLEVRICPLVRIDVLVDFWMFPGRLVHEDSERSRTGMMVPCVALPVLSVRPGTAFKEKNKLLVKYLKTDILNDKLTN